MSKGFIDFKTPQTSVCETRTLRRVSLDDDQSLVVELCRLPFDLAAPLLQSRLTSLSVPSLLAIIAATGEAHHRMIARQADLDPRVIKALLKGNQPMVAQTLLTAAPQTFDADAAKRMAQLARANPPVAAAIQAHPTLGLAKGHLKLTPDDALSHSNLKLLRLLRGGAKSSFILEAARRLEVEPTALARFLDRPSAIPLALTTSALGLDRAVFLDLLAYWQAHHGNAFEFNEVHRKLTLSVFDLSADGARAKLTAQLR